MPVGYKVNFLYTIRDNLRLIRTVFKDENGTTTVAFKLAEPTYYVKEFYLRIHFTKVEPLTLEADLEISTEGLV